MNILVYGAGNIGSPCSEADVTIPPEVSRLHEIREHGILLQDFPSGQMPTTRIEAVERLAPDAAYDLVLVILPRNNVSKVVRSDHLESNRRAM